MRAYKMNGEEEDPDSLVTREVSEAIVTDEGDEGDEEEDDDEKFFSGTFRVSDDSGLTEDEVTRLLAEFMDAKFTSVDLEVTAE